MIYKDLIDLFRQLNSKNIVYNKAYYRLTGSVQGAVLLSHLTYLFSEVFGGKEFYQSDKQLMESLGFSQRTLRTAKDSCKRYATSTMRGVPAKNHWVINEHAVISDLVSEPCVKPSFVENDIAGDVENDTTGPVENVTCNNKENKNKDLKIKSSSSCLLEADQLINNSPVPRHIIDELIQTHGSEKVHKQLKNLTTRFGIVNPSAWLRTALEQNYESKVNAAPPSPNVLNFSPPSYETWSEAHQKKYNADRERLASTDDWRDKLADSCHMDACKINDRIQKIKTKKENKKP